MRKIILGTVLGLVFSIGAYTSAKAGNGFCEPSDPCEVWEMIQPNGAIGRIICTPSVCGSGFFNGSVVRLEATPTPRLEPWPTFIVPTYPPEQPTAAPPQLTSEPSSPPATSVEPTSGPQPAPEATSQPAPEATPAPPVVGAPTSTPVVVAVATAAPTQLPAVVVVTVVGTSSISIPSVSVTALRKTQEEQEDEEEWELKRRRWGGEQQAI